MQVPTPTDRWDERPGRPACKPPVSVVNTMPSDVTMASDATVPLTDSTARGSLACVILCHTDPTQVRRLIAALDPLPVFLHCDASTPPTTFREIVTELPDRCVLLHRTSTGWAKWENVAAELAGYRAALDATDATHFALLTGSDYPLASADEIESILGRYLRVSMAMLHSLPHAGWGRSGGLDRLRYRHWAYRKHMLRLPIPRQIPKDVVLAGGSQLKILARHHARAVVETAVRRPDLVRFWRRSWVADETFVPSILSTPRFVPDWEERHIPLSPWWIGWDGSRRKSPPWLTMEYREALLTRQTHQVAEIPRLFARKFSTADSSPLLDAIDSELLNPAAEQA